MAHILGLIGASSAAVGAGFTGLFVGLFAGRLARLVRHPPASAGREETQVEPPRQVATAIESLGDLAADMRSSVAGYQGVVGDLAARLKSSRCDAAAPCDGPCDEPIGESLDGPAQAANDEPAQEANGEPLVEPLDETIGRVLSASEKLQARLLSAEEQIRYQAQQLRTHAAEARTDALTGLANRRAFDALLSQCHERFGQDQSPYALVMLDIDGLKPLNDSLGHVVGDEVLRSIGRTLAASVTGLQLACRYGGDEFALLLPGADLAEARACGERVRQAIKKITVEPYGDAVTVSASVGVAAVLEGEAPADLVRRADDAVYVSKRAGRDLTHWHDGRSYHRLLGTAPAPASAVKRPRLPKTVHDGIRSGDLPDAELFGQLLKRQLAESRRFGHPLSVIRITVGPAPGAENDDAAWSEEQADAVAQAVYSAIREMDLLARMGESDFIVMLPSTGAAAARIVAERTAARVESQPLTSAEGPSRHELHLGIATADSAETAEQLIERASQARFSRLQPGSSALRPEGATAECGEPVGAT